MTDNNLDPEDTGQISVAELLARNGQKSTGTSTGGRRRRGVKGGISVAELTGEIPIVRAEPVSDEAPAIAAPRAKAPEARTPEPKAPEAKAPEAKAPQAKAPEPKAPEAEKPAVEPPASAAPATEAPHKEPELMSGSTTAAGDLLNRAHDESARRPYGSTPSQRPTPATGKRPVPDTRGTTDKTTQRPTRSSGFVARPRVQRSEADAEPKTDVTAKADSTLSAETRSRTEPKPPVQPKTTAVPEVSADSEVPAESTSATTTDPVEKDLDPKTEILKAEVSKTPVAEDGDAATEITPAVVDEPDEVEHGRSGKKDAAKQWLALAGQGVVAVIVGALLFKGFERLWDMLPWVALILAVLVIVGLVAVVRILRRTDDMISMVIAIAVGVFVTLGPLAFQLSTG